MREAGVIGPEMACPVSELPEIVRSDLDRYVDAEIIREGASGTFYLHEGQASALLRQQILKAVVFWFLVIIIPVVILQLSNSRTPPP
jgi:hypothetical protein